MAIVRAVKTGNWSDVTVWNTGALPTSSDEVYSNGFNVTIDIDVTVQSIRTYGSYAGGAFFITSARTVACSSGFFIGQYGFVVTSATGRTINLVGSFTPPTGGGRSTVINGTFGTVNITGSLITTGSNFSNIFLGDSGQSSITVNVTGDLYGGGSSVAGGIDVGSTTEFVNVTGNLYAGTVAGAIVNIGGNSIIDHVGACYAANNVPAISTGTAITLTMTGPFYVSTNGTHGVYSPVWKWKNTSPSFYQVRSASLATIRTLYTADSVGGNPAIGNVRSGTVYGPAGELTGTCAVPGASSVLSGVPIDNTTGTATITPESIRSALGMASANLDTQLAAIPTTPAPTVTAIRTELDTNSTKLANLDATVSSRLATSGYTAPPSASTNATAVRTELSTELGRIDATISSRLAPAGTLARVTLVDTATTLTNAPVVPSASQIASQVRTELSTELARIDTTVGSRLAASGYTVPPTAAVNASAVRTELATELGRIDATVTSRLAPSGTLARVTLTDTATTLTNAPVVPSAAAIASQVRTELTPELARVTNCATVATTGQQIEDALNN